MAVLRIAEKQNVIDCAAEIIKSTGDTGIRSIPDPAAVNRRGNDEINYLISGTSFPIEISVITADVLKKQKADLIINILPGQSLDKEDRIDIAGKFYKVNSIEEHNLFGTKTHREVRLIKRLQ